MPKKAHLSRKKSKRRVKKVRIADSEVSNNLAENGLKMKENYVQESTQEYTTKLADDIRIKLGDTVLYCNNCREPYEDYCTNCHMLAHILDGYTYDDTENEARGELPKDILEMKQTNDSVSIFALKVIPQGVRFGPVPGLYTSEGIWKIYRGKLSVCDNYSSHWLHHINSVTSPYEQNLRVFRYANKIYYSSTREILEGDELLVYFGDHFRYSFFQFYELNFVPYEERDIGPVFACTFCCFGFSSLVSLVKHKGFCFNGIARKSSIKVIVQCSLCEVNMEEEEYQFYHKHYCHEKHALHFDSTLVSRTAKGSCE